MQNIAIAQQIARTIYDKKGVDIVALNVSELTVLCDYMILASGRSSRQVSAIADEIDERLAAQGLTPQRTEGLREGRWVILDYGAVIVHLFHPEDREYYHLERLWDEGSNRLVLTFDQTEDAQ